MTFTSRHQAYGILVMGLGLIFFGMAVMSGAMKPLRTFEPFIARCRTLVRAGTAVMTMGGIVLASQGLILEGGIGLRSALAPAPHWPRSASRAKRFGWQPTSPSRSRSAADRLVHPGPGQPLAGRADAWTGWLPTRVANAHTLFNVGIDSCSCPSREYSPGSASGWCPTGRSPIPRKSRPDTSRSTWTRCSWIPRPWRSSERSWRSAIGERVSDMYEVIAHRTGWRKSPIGAARRISSGELSRKETDALIRLMRRQPD